MLKTNLSEILLFLDRLLQLLPALPQGRSRTVYGSLGSPASFESSLKSTDEVSDTAPVSSGPCLSLSAYRQNHLTLITGDLLGLHNNKDKWQHKSQLETCSFVKLPEMNLYCNMELPGRPLVGVRIPEHDFRRVTRGGSPCFNGSLSTNFIH